MHPALSRDRAKTRKMTAAPAEPEAPMSGEKGDPSATGVSAAVSAGDESLAKTVSFAKSSENSGIPAQEKSSASKKWLKAGWVLAFELSARYYWYKKIEIKMAEQFSQDGENAKGGPEASIVPGQQLLFIA